MVYQIQALSSVLLFPPIKTVEKLILFHPFQVPPKQNGWTAENMLLKMVSLPPCHFVLFPQYSSYCQLKSWPQRVRRILLNIISFDKKLSIVKLYKNLVFSNPFLIPSSLIINCSCAQQCKNCLIMLDAQWEAGVVSTVWSLQGITAARLVPGLVPLRFQLTGTLSNSLFHLFLTPVPCGDNYDRQRDNSVASTNRFVMTEINGSWYIYVSFKSLASILFYHEKETSKTMELACFCTHISDHCE